MKKLFAAIPATGPAPATATQPWQPAAATRRWTLGGLLGSALLLSAHGAQAQAQVDTIRLGDQQLRPAVLQPGRRQYLVYFQNPAQRKKLGFWLWLRDVQRQQRNGEAVIAIRQHWYGSDTSSYRVLSSLNRAADFAPLYHSETSRGQRKTYNWQATGIAGADSVAGNQAAGYRLTWAQPNFNWNLDIETFEMLPLAAGKSFALNFYDAGLELPRYVVYRVIGSEVLHLPGGAKTRCWKLFTEGQGRDGSPYTETYWLSQRTHEFLKEEDTFGGMRRYKIRVLTTPDELLQWFR